MLATNIVTQPIRYVSEKIVSEMTGIPISTLQKHRHFRRGIPYVKFGRTIRYCVQAVVDYMDAHKIDHGSQGAA